MSTIRAPEGALPEAAAPPRPTSPVSRRPLSPGLRIAAIIGVVLLPGCGQRNPSGEALDFLRRTEGREYQGQEVSRERIQELEADIEEYQDDVEEVVRKLSEVAVFRKLLAEEFLEQEMYGPALENLQAAMELQPANAVLFHLAGITSAQTAQAFVEDPARREEYLRQAESYYLRALELDGEYRECLYAISVLYVYELEEPASAEQYIEALLRIDPENTRARFVRARMLVELGRLEDAADLYGQIAEDANSRDQRRRALENRRQLLEGEN